MILTNEERRNRYNAAVRQAYLALAPEDRARIDRQKEILIDSIRNCGEQAALELLMKVGTALNGRTRELDEVLMGVDKREVAN